MTPLEIGLWAMMSLCALAVFSTIALIGRYRQPISPSLAIYTLIVNAIYVAILFSAWREIHG